MIDSIGDVHSKGNVRNGISTPLNVICTESPLPACPTSFCMTWLDFDHRIKNLVEAHEFFLICTIRRLSKIQLGALQ